MLTKSNAVGYAVLALVVNELDDSEVREINVEPYLNGRESGFAIHFWSGKNKLVFSRARNSDYVVVYEGRVNDFSMQGNSLTDEIYRNGRYFENASSAANHVVKMLRCVS